MPIARSGPWLRNPFTFAFQPHTGAMLINEVGAATFEEINAGAAGANYGWPTTEGPTSTAGVRSPIQSYRHDTGSPTGCAITGGAFYNPEQAEFPASYTLASISLRTIVVIGSTTSILHHRAR